VTLSFHGINLSYGTVPVLHDLSFEFQDAEIVAIVGPNGSGKSSLVRCLNKLVTPQSGEVCIGGENVYQMHAREIAKIFGYVPQNFQDIFPAMVIDTILMGRKPYATWRSSKNDIMKVTEVMKLLHIEEFALRYHSELSGGQRQKVMIARAFAQESKVLLFDEPTSQLDIKHQLEIMDLVKETVRTKKILAILVVHDLNLASRYANRIIMLKDGRIHAVGDPKSVFNEDNIRAVYDVDCLIMHDGEVPCVVAKKQIIQSGHESMAE